MSGNKKSALLNASLSDLVQRFQKEDVVEEMEKRYQSAPTRLISTESIDDNRFIAEAPIRADVVASFAEQLRSRGIYNPLVLKRKGDRYELVLGRKRLFGAKAAGIVSLPAVITDIGEEEELLVLLADNRDQRESSILEMALLCHELQTRFGYKVTTLAGLTHQSRSQIANTLRLLGLPTSLRSDLNQGKLSYGHARALAGLDEATALMVAKAIYEGHLSVRATERYVQDLRDGVNVSSALKEGVRAYEGTVVEGRKEIRIRFDSEEAKQRFIADLFENKAA